MVDLIVVYDSDVNLQAGGSLLWTIKEHAGLYAWIQYCDPMDIYVARDVYKSSWIEYWETQDWLIRY